MGVLRKRDHSKREAVKTVCGNVTGTQIQNHGQPQRQGKVPLEQFQAIMGEGGPAADGQMGEG